MTEFDGLPALRSPVLVAAFEGWNDAGDAATGVVEHLELAWEATPFAVIDPDDYYDFQVNRPSVSLADDGGRRIEWPTTRLSTCAPAAAGRDVVLLRGLEPNMRWRGFCDEILSLCHDLEVDLVILLGALLSDSPHTRPVPVSGTSSDAAAARRLALPGSTYEGPTGIVGVMADAAGRSGLPTTSLWAQVPHYVSQPPCPKATLALLRRLEDVLDFPVPVGDLPESAQTWQETVDALAGEDEEMSDYVRQLEQREPESDLPEVSGEQIARDFERYLRRQDGGR